MKKSNKGFTLIELLVVIAIIGILSAIVLASLSSARSKANDAKVEGQAVSMRNAAEIYSSTNGSYGMSVPAQACSVSSPAGSMFTDTGASSSGMASLVTAILGTTGVGLTSCYVNPTGSAWMVAVGLPSDATANTGYWCVDSSGKSEKVATNVTATASGSALCP